MGCIYMIKKRIGNTIVLDAYYRFSGILTPDTLKVGIARMHDLIRNDRFLSLNRKTIIPSGEPVILKDKRNKDTVIRQQCVCDAGRTAIPIDQWKKEKIYQSLGEVEELCFLI